MVGLIGVVSLEFRSSNRLLMGTAVPGRDVSSEPVRTDRDSAILGAERSPAIHWSDGHTFFGYRPQCAPNPYQGDQ